MTVDSLQTLISMATAEREWVVADSEAGGYYLCREGVVYEFPSETVSANLAGREDTNEGDEGALPNRTKPIRLAGTSNRIRNHRFTIRQRRLTPISWEMEETVGRTSRRTAAKIKRAR